MADGFRIPFQEAESEFVEKRSRFISRVWRVETEEEAQARIQETKKKYYDARHNCWCYLLGPNLVRYSDDGEPQGTAGQPMLNVFQRENVTGAVCVVTRYFGGILLGAGGLVRAYTQAVKEGLAHCETGILRKGCELEVTTDYNDVGKLQYYFGQQHIVPIDSIYTENVKFILLIPMKNEEKVRKNLIETTCGKVKIEKLKETYFVDKE